MGVGRPPRRNLSCGPSLIALFLLFHTPRSCSRLSVVCMTYSKSNLGRPDGVLHMMPFTAMNCDFTWGYFHLLLIGNSELRLTPVVGIY